MNSQCPGSGRVIAVKKLQYGMKWYISDECPKNIESVQHVNTTTCCQYEEGDCLRNITDYNDKYLYLSRLSRLPVISQNTATPRQYMTCTNNNRTYSNYVQVVFDCVEGKMTLLFYTLCKEFQTQYPNNKMHWLLFMYIYVNFIESECKSSLGFFRYVWGGRGGYFFIGEGRVHFFQTYAPISAKLSLHFKACVSEYTLSSK